MKHIRHCLTALFAITISLMVWADSGELFHIGQTVKFAHQLHGAG